MKHTMQGSAILIVLILLSGMMMTLSIYWRSVVYSSHLCNEQYQWYKKRYEKENLLLWACSICIHNFDEIINCCIRSGGSVRLPVDQVNGLNLLATQAYIEVASMIDDNPLLQINVYDSSGKNSCCISRKNTPSGNSYAITAWSIT